MRELDLLATFVEVYRAGSVTAAAGRLGLSQPSVSERISRLEAHLDTALFERSSAGVSPTPAADRLAGEVGEAVDRLRTVWSAPPEEQPDTAVRIGGASDLVAARILPALAPLTARGIRIEFTLGLAPDLLMALQEGVLDLVVSSVRTAATGIRYRGLVDEEFVLVGAPSLARTIDPVLRDADPRAALSHLPLVAYDTDLSILRRYWRSQFGHRPGNRIAVVVPDLRGILAAVIAGAGASTLPRYLADPAIAAGSVVVLHEPAEPPINTLHLAIASSAAPSPALGSVIDTLVARARTWDTL